MGGNTPGGKFPQKGQMGLPHRLEGNGRNGDPGGGGAQSRERCIQGVLETPGFSPRGGRAIDPHGADHAQISWKREDGTPGGGESPRPGKPTGGAPGGGQHPRGEGEKTPSERGGANRSI